MATPLVKKKSPSTDPAVKDKPNELKGAYKPQDINGLKGYYPAKITGETSRPTGTPMSSAVDVSNMTREQKIAQSELAGSVGRELRLQKQMNLKNEILTKLYAKAAENNGITLDNPVQQQPIQPTQPVVSNQLDPNIKATTDSSMTENVLQGGLTVANAASKNPITTGLYNAAIGSIPGVPNNAVTTGQATTNAAIGAAAGVTAVGVVGASMISPAAVGARIAATSLKSIGLKTLLTLGGISGSLKLKVSTAQSILSNSITDIETTIKGVEDGSISYSDGQALVNEALNNIDDAESSIKFASKIPLDFLGFKDTIKKFSSARKLVIPRVQQRLDQAYLKQQVNSQTQKINEQKLLYGIQ